MTTGTHEIEFVRLLGRRVPAPATAGVTENGEIVLMLGDCCDQGEIGARGRLKNDTIRGQWTETSLGGGRQGTFILNRMPQP